MVVWTLKLLIVVLVVGFSACVKVDKIQAFYDLLNSNPGVKHCPDKTRLLPGCTNCIPGMKEGKSKTCDEFTTASADIRAEIKKLTLERYGDNMDPKRPFGLYPYLELPDFVMRQELFGRTLSDMKARDIVDVGAYYNPIHLFLNATHCPNSVVVIEPILDPLSAMVPCPGGVGQTHVVFLPVTFRFYITVAGLLPRPDSVVCIGCDSHYGPTRKMLETTFVRPFTLLLEYPSEYVHNAPFRKMMGTDAGEKMTFMKKFQPVTNETKYTKRVMKIIEYKNV